MSTCYDRIMYSMIRLMITVILLAGCGDNLPGPKQPTAQVPGSNVNNGLPFHR